MLKTDSRVETRTRRSITDYGYEDNRLTAV